jgi:hypothetical protein
MAAAGYLSLCAAYFWLRRSSGLKLIQEAAFLADLQQMDH